MPTGATPPPPSSSARTNSRAGKVQIKDLAAGKEQAAAIADHETWREERPGQFEVRRADLVAEVRKLLKRQKAG